jgi:hypothetical protein
MAMEVSLLSLKALEPFWLLNMLIIQKHSKEW